MVNYDKEISEIRHALRIGASKEEYDQAVKKYSRPVILEIPLGELCGNRALTDANEARNGNR